MSTKCAMHLQCVMNPAERVNVVGKAVSSLNQVKDSFDAVAMRGLSGLLIGIPIADKLDKEMLIVRKGEETHSMYGVEGSVRPNCRYIIVDDLVATGNTIFKIIKYVRGHNKSAKCVGLYLYYGDRVLGYEELKEYLRPIAKYNCNEQEYIDAFGLPETPSNAWPAP